MPSYGYIVSHSEDYEKADTIIMNNVTYTGFMEKSSGKMYFYKIVDGEAIEIKKEEFEKQYERAVEIIENAISSYYYVYMFFFFMNLIFTLMLCFFGVPLTRQVSLVHLAFLLISTALIYTSSLSNFILSTLLPISLIFNVATLVFNLK